LPGVDANGQVNSGLPNGKLLESIVLHGFSPFSNLKSAISAFSNLESAISAFPNLKSAISNHRSFSTTINSFPRSSITFTAICRLSPASNGALVILKSLNLQWPLFSNLKSLILQ
jgi:hypothetical protein